MTTRAFEALVDEVLAILAAEGITGPREKLRSKMAAALWHAVTIDEDTGTCVELVTGRKVPWDEYWH